MTKRQCRITPCWLLLFAPAVVAFQTPSIQTRLLQPASQLEWALRSVGGSTSSGSSLPRRTQPLCAGASDAFQAAVRASSSATEESFTDWGPEGATLSDTWEVDVYSRPVCTSFLHFLFLRFCRSQATQSCCFRVQPMLVTQTKAPCL